MSTVANLMVKIGSDISDLEKGMSKAERKLEDVGRSMRSIGTKMTAAITVPMAALGTQAIKSAANFESLQQSMNILNRSVEEGTRNFERLKEFSAETPFQLRDLAEAQNMLQGFGQSADDAFESMSMIGDIAAVASGDIKGIGIAFGQAAAEGRLMTRDIRQLINQGVPAIKLLADTMDVAQSEVLDLASNGEISFEILQQAFEDATTEGGMFANGMEKQANTLAGVWSTLKDNVSIALGELGNSIVETFDLKQLVKDLTANIQQITERFQSMSRESQAQILKVAGLIGAGGPLLIAFGQAAIAVSAFSKLVRTRFAAITASAAVFAGAVEWSSDVLVNAFGDSERQVKSFAKSARDRLTRVIKPIIDFAEESIGAADALEEFQNLLNNLTGGGLTEVNQVLKDTRDILSFINGDINALNEGLQDVFNMEAPEVDRSWRESIFETKDAVNELGEDIGEMPEMEMMDKGIKAASRSLETLRSNMKAYTNMQEKLDPESEGFWMLGNAIRGAQKAIDLLRSKMKIARGELLDYGETARLVFDDFKLAAQAAFGTIVDEATTAFGNALFKAREYNMEELKLRKRSLKQQEQALRERLSNEEIAQEEFNLKLAQLYNQQSELEAKMAKAREGVFQRSMNAMIQAAQDAVRQILAEFAKIAFIKGISALLGFGGVTTAAGFAEESFDAIGLAQGGLAFGPTMAMVGDNPNARTDPEVISPLSKLKDMVGGGTQHVEVEGKIRGDTIHLANARGANKFR